MSDCFDQPAGWNSLAPAAQVFSFGLFGYCCKSGNDADSAFVLLAKLKINPKDNAISQSLAGAGAEHAQDLSKLSGTAFDRAYAQNELAYHVFVTGALETTLIPSTQNSQVKSLLQNGLALFEQHRNEAAQLASSSGNSGEGALLGASECPEEQGPDWVANGSGAGCQKRLSIP